MAYSIMETPFKRDIVKELCDAARGRGIPLTCIFHMRIGTTTIFVQAGGIKSGPAGQNQRRDED